jgi:hypothetical protein
MVTNLLLRLNENFSLSSLVPVSKSCQCNVTNSQMYAFQFKCKVNAWLACSASTLTALYKRNRSDRINGRKGSLLWSILNQLLGSNSFLEAISDLVGREILRF